MSRNLPVPVDPAKPEISVGVDGPTDSLLNPTTLDFIAEGVCVDEAPVRGFTPRLSSRLISRSF